MAHEVLLVNQSPVVWVIMGRTGKRGRPRIHPDRKAYLAEKARERRAKLKQSPST